MHGFLAESGLHSVRYNTFSLVAVLFFIYFLGLWLFIRVLFSTHIFKHTVLSIVGVYKVFENWRNVSKNKYVHKESSFRRDLNPLWFGAWLHFTAYPCLIFTGLAQHGGFYHHYILFIQKKSRNHLRFDALKRISWKSSEYLGIHL